MMPLPGGAAGARRHVLALRHRDRRLRLDVGAARDEQLDDVRMVFGDGPHQRRLRADRVLRVDGGAAVEQQRDRIDVARCAPRSSAPSRRRVWRCSRRRRRSSSRRRIAALPLIAATCIGVTPYRVAAFTSAPLLISVSTVLRSFSRTAWCSGVDPSEPTLPSRASASRAAAEGGATWASVAGPSASRNPTIRR